MYFINENKAKMTPVISEPSNMWKKEETGPTVENLGIHQSVCSFWCFELDHIVIYNSINVQIFHILNSWLEGWKNKLHEMERLI